MRSSLLPGLLDMVALQPEPRQQRVRLFEAGEIFAKSGERHEEHRTLAFAATGNLIAANVHHPAEAYTFFHMKGDIEDLLAAFQHSSLYFDAMTPPYLSPRPFGTRRARRRNRGALRPAPSRSRRRAQAAPGRLHRRDTARSLYKHSLREPKYERISKFPAVERDFSFVFDDAVTFERIRSAVERLASPRCSISRRARSIAARRSAAGKYSALLHAEFQSKERTLRDDEVAQWSSQIVQTLEKLGGVIRG